SQRQEDRSLLARVSGAARHQQHEERERAHQNLTAPREAVGSAGRAPTPAPTPTTTAATTTAPARSAQIQGRRCATTTTRGLSGAGAGAATGATPGSGLALSGAGPSGGALAALRCCSMAALSEAICRSTSSRLLTPGRRR